MPFKFYSAPCVHSALLRSARHRSALRIRSAPLGSAHTFGTARRARSALLGSEHTLGFSRTLSSAPLCSVPRIRSPLHGSARTLGPARFCGHARLCACARPCPAPCVRNAEVAPAHPNAPGRTGACIPAGAAQRRAYARAPRTYARSCADRRARARHPRRDDHACGAARKETSIRAELAACVV